MESDGYIVVLGKSKKGSPYKLDQGDHTIGSSIDSSIRLKSVNPLLLETHVIIRVNHVGVATVINKSTAAPIRINGKIAFKPTILRHNDKFQILKREFQYVNDKLKDEPENSEIFAEAKRQILASRRKSVMVSSKTPVKSPMDKRTKSSLKTPSQRLSDKTSTTVKTSRARLLSLNPHQVPNTSTPNKIDKRRLLRRSISSVKGDQGVIIRPDNSTEEVENASNTNATLNLTDFEKAARLSWRITPSRRFNNSTDNSLGYINTPGPLEDIDNSMSSSQISTVHNTRETTVDVHDEGTPNTVSRSGSTLAKRMSTFDESTQDINYIGTKDKSEQSQSLPGNSELNSDTVLSPIRPSSSRKSTRASTIIMPSSWTRNISGPVENIDNSMSSSQTSTVHNSRETTVDSHDDDDEGIINTISISKRMSTFDESTQDINYIGRKDKSEQSQSLPGNSKLNSDTVLSPVRPSSLRKSTRASTIITPSRRSNNWTKNVSGPLENIDSSMSSSQISTVHNSRVTTVDSHDDEDDDEGIIINTISISKRMSTFDESTQELNFDNAKQSQGFPGNSKQIEPISIQDDSDSVLSPVRLLSQRKSTRASNRITPSRCSNNLTKNALGPMEDIDNSMSSSQISTVQNARETEQSQSLRGSSDTVLSPVLPLSSRKSMRASQVNRSPLKAISIPSTRRSLRSSISESSSLNTASLDQSTGLAISVSSQSFSSFKKGRNGSDDEITTNTVSRSGSTLAKRFSTFDESTQEINFSGTKNKSKQSTSLSGNSKQVEPISILDDSDTVLSPVPPLSSRKSVRASQDIRRSSTRRSLRSQVSESSSLNTASLDQSTGGSVISVSSQSFSSFKKGQNENDDDTEIDVVNFTMEGDTLEPAGDFERRPLSAVPNMFDTTVSFTSTPFQKTRSTTELRALTISSSEEFSLHVSDNDISKRRRSSRSSVSKRGEDSCVSCRHSSVRRSRSLSATNVVPDVEMMHNSVVKSAHEAGTTPIVDRNSHGEDETPKSHLEPARRSSQASQSTYNPVLEDITPVTPEKLQVSGPSEAFKTPINTPGLFDSIRKSAVRSRKRRRDSSGSALKDSKRARINENEQSQAKRKQNSPLNRLSNFEGVKKLMKTPQKSPRNDLRNVPNLRNILSPKQQNSPRNNLTDVSGVADMFNVSVGAGSDIENSIDLFTKLTGKMPVKAYRKHKSFSPAAKGHQDAPISRKTMDALPSYSPRVQEWVDEHAEYNSGDKNASSVSEKSVSRTTDTDNGISDLFRPSSAGQAGHVLENVSEEPNRRARIGRSITPKKLGQTKGKRRHTQGENQSGTENLNFEPNTFDMDNSTSGTFDLLQCSTENILENVTEEPNRKARIGRSVTPKKLSQPQEKRRKTQGGNLSETPDVTNWISAKKSRRSALETSQKPNTSDMDNSTSGTFDLLQCSTENILRNVSEEPNRKARIGRSMTPKKNNQPEKKHRKTQGGNLSETPDVTNWISAKKSRRSALETSQKPNTSDMDNSTSGTFDLLQYSFADQVENILENVSAQPIKKPRIARSITPKKVSRPEGKRRKTQGDNLSGTPDVGNWKSGTFNPLQCSTETILENVSEGPNRKARIGRSVTPKKPSQPERKRRKTQGGNLSGTPDVTNWVSSLEVEASQNPISGRKISDLDNSISGTFDLLQCSTENILENVTEKPNRKARLGRSVTPKNLSQPERRRRKTQGATLSGTPDVTNWVSEKKSRRSATSLELEASQKPNLGPKMSDMDNSISGTFDLLQCSTENILENVTEEPNRKARIGRSVTPKKLSQPQEKRRNTQGFNLIGSPDVNNWISERKFDRSVTSLELEPSQKPNCVQKISDSSICSPAPPLNKSEIAVSSMPNRDTKAVVTPVEVPKLSTRRNKLKSTEDVNNPTIEGSSEAPNKRTRKGKGKSQHQEKIKAEVVQAPARRGTRRGKATEVEQLKEKEKDIGTTNTDATLSSLPVSSTLKAVLKPVEVPKPSTRRNKLKSREEVNSPIVESSLEDSNKRTKKGKGKSQHEEKIKAEVVQSPARRRPRRGKATEVEQLKEKEKDIGTTNTDATLSPLPVSSTPKAALTPVEVPKPSTRRNKLKSSEEINSLTVESSLEDSNKRTRKGKGNSQHEEKIKAEVVQSLARRGPRRGKAIEVEHLKEKEKDTTNTDATLSPLPVSSTPKVVLTPVEVLKPSTRRNKLKSSEGVNSLTVESSSEDSNKRTRKGKGKTQHEENMKAEVVQSPARRGPRRGKATEVEQLKEKEKDIGTTNTDATLSPLPVSSTPKAALTPVEVPKPSTRRNKLKSSEEINSPTVESSLEDSNKRTRKGNGKTQHEENIKAEVVQSPARKGSRRGKATEVEQLKEKEKDIGTTNTDATLSPLPVSSTLKAVLKPVEVSKPSTRRNKLKSSEEVNSPTVESSSEESNKRTRKGKGKNQHEEKIKAEVVQSPARRGPRRGKATEVEQLKEKEKVIGTNTDVTLSPLPVSSTSKAVLAPVEVPKPSTRRNKLKSREEINSSTVESSSEDSNKRTRKGKGKTQHEENMKAEVVQSPARKGSRRGKATEVEQFKEKEKDIGTTNTDATLSPLPVSSTHKVVLTPVEVPKPSTRRNKLKSSESVNIPTVESSSEDSNKRTRKGKGKSQHEKKMTTEVGPRKGKTAVHNEEAVEENEKFASPRRLRSRRGENKQ